MSTAKKSKPKTKTAAKAAPKTSKAKAVAAPKKQPSSAMLAAVAVCITFLLLVDTYYIAVLVQAHS